MERQAKLEIGVIEAARLDEQIEAMFERMRQAHQSMQADQNEIERLKVQTSALLADLQERDWYRHVETVF